MRPFVPVASSYNTTLAASAVGANTRNVVAAAEYVAPNSAVSSANKSASSNTPRGTATASPWKPSTRTRYCISATASGSYKIASMKFDRSRPPGATSRSFTGWVTCPASSAT